MRTTLSFILLSLFSFQYLHAQNNSAELVRNINASIEGSYNAFNFYEKTYEFYVKSLFYEDIEDEKEVLEEAITWLTEAYKDLVKFNRFCSEARDAGDLQENKLQKLIKEALQKKKRDSH